MKTNESKKQIAEQKRALLNRIKNKGLERTKIQKFERKTGFINYYRYVDGIYNSY